MPKILTTILAVMAAAMLQANQGFVFEKARDPMTDADRSFIMIRSAGGREVLAWKCNGSKDPEIVFEFDRYMVGLTDWQGRRTTHVWVTKRFPPAPPMKRSLWGLTTAQTGVIVRSRKFWQEFTGAGIASGRVVLEVTDMTERVTAEFDLTGLADAVRQLPCGADGRR